MKSRELQRKIINFKRNQFSKVIETLEKLGIEFDTLDSEDWGGAYRLRMVLDKVKGVNDNMEYKYSDIWYSNFDGGWIVRDYFKEVV